MDLSKFMDGKLTVRAAACAIAAGVYLIAYQVGGLLEVETTTLRDIVAEVLKGEGFKTVLFGVLAYGFRRAVAKGGTLESPTDKTEADEEKSTQELLTQLIEQLEKENPK